ncbi:MAG: transposase [Nitrospirae bacterium]|nr:transposase [Nitrospirota bacterium]
MDNHPVRKKLRLDAYDYSSNGYYFITLCAKDAQAFHRHRQIIVEALDSLPAKFPGLTLDYSVVMDDHLHIILVLDGVDKVIGEIVRQYKSVVTHVANEKNIWQKGYYEHVIRNEKALYKIRKYIHNNPLVKELSVEQFY